MIRFFLLSAIVVAGLATMLFAGRRDWRPTLPQALAVAAVFRLLALIISAGNRWQPYDFVNDFTAAGNAVLHHVDPLAVVRDGGWHFLPPMAYVFAGELKLGAALGIGWPVLGRILPVAADLVTVALVGRIATRHPAAARLQYACNPVAILVCAVHGQIEPVALALGLGGLVAAQSRRPYLSGGLLGAAIACNTWPVLLLPGVLLLHRGGRARARALAGTAAVPLAFLLTIPLAASGGYSGLLTTVEHLLRIRPVTGEWGWGAVVDMLGGSHGALVVSPTIGRIGTGISVVVLALVLYLWRRAQPYELTSALALALLATTSRFGAQYLLWPAPFLAARPNRWSRLTVVVSGLWAATGYLYLVTLPGNAYWAGHGPWSLASLAVIACLVATVTATPRGVRSAAPALPVAVQPSPVLAD